MTEQLNITQIPDSALFKLPSGFFMLAYLDKEFNITAMQEIDVPDAGDDYHTLCLNHVVLTEISRENGEFAGTVNLTTFEIDHLGEPAIVAEIPVPDLELIIKSLIDEYLGKGAVRH